jgi:hypothetical protein
MENKDFAVFILTHGRPDNIKTLKLLNARGYTGPIYYIVDNEDKTVDKYIKNFGINNVKVFDKKAMADSIDEGNNFDERRTITHARNACFNIAKEIGITYFIQLDDDYYSLGYRYLEGEKKINNLNKVFDIMLKFYKSINAKSIAFSQGGDHIGGFQGIKLKRKCMNSFICSTKRQFKFVGAMNEDVNTYTSLGSRGDLFFTFTNINLSQGDTQSQGGGITEMYVKYGTYCKAFSTVMMHPSSVKVSMMNCDNPRIHHSIKWQNTTPMILGEKHKKNNLKPPLALTSNESSLQTQ